MRSITVRAIGGLGNQLHCYAFGRAVAAQNGADLKMDAESGFWNEPYNREYLLDRFPGLLGNRAGFRLESGSSRLLYRIAMKVLRLISKVIPVPFKLVIEEEHPRHYQQEVHRAKYRFNPYFIGYWASYLYYQDIEKELRRELKPPAPTHPAALELLAKVRAVRSCFIHWRSYKEETTMNRHDYREYYRAAVEFVFKKYPDIVFFVFSDDPPQAAKELSFPGHKVIYADLSAARENAQVFADFYLMCMCAHAIIGPSTFSWWAAWLGEDREDKIVVFPRGVSPWWDECPPPHWIGLDLTGSLK